MADAERQRQEYEEPERVQEACHEETVLLDGVDGVAFEAAFTPTNAASATLKYDEKCDESTTVQQVPSNRSIAEHSLKIEICDNLMSG